MAKFEFIRGVGVPLYSLLAATRHLIYGGDETSTSASFDFIKARNSSKTVVNRWSDKLTHFTMKMLEGKKNEEPIITNYSAAELAMNRIRENSKFKVASLS
jgi:hypothetical protein